MEDYAVSILPLAPQVESVTIKGADTTRSKVTSLVVQFDTEVEHAVLSSAFTVTNITTNMADGTVNVAATDASGKTSGVLTFAGASTITPTLVTLRTSLADGNDRLDIAAAQVKLAGGNLAVLAADIAFSGQTTANDPNDAIFRQYGDSNGDGSTNFGDFASSFLPKFGSERP